MVVDLNKCLGCHTCAVTCKAEWQVPSDKSRSWVKHFGPSNTSSGLSYTFYSGRCNHCDNPVCIGVCPVTPVSKTFHDEDSNQSKNMSITATWKDPFNGIVQIDQDRCIGCGACVNACPYEARYLKDVKGKSKKADKCSFCIERLANGMSPACVDNCLTDAMFFGDLHDPTSKVYEYVNNGAIRLRSSAVDIGPNVYYFGRSKDIELLTSLATPSKLPDVSERRTFLKQILP